MVIEGITLHQMVGSAELDMTRHVQLVQLQGIVADRIACFVDYRQIMDKLWSTGQSKLFH